MEKTKKEFVWELNDYSGSVFAETEEEAKEILLNELSIQEVENETI